MNVAIALALGLSMRFIHRRIEGLVDRAFFRKRHEDEMALRRFAHESTYITDRETLLDRTAGMIERHAGASSVQLFLANGRGYVVANGSGAAAVVDENDPALLAMRTWHEPVDLHRYNTVLKGDTAFPMSSRGKVLGVLVCGPRTSGEAYAPDDVEALENVAQGVASALQSLAVAGQDTQARMLEMLQKIFDELRASRNS